MPLWPWRAAAAVEASRGLTAAAAVNPTTQQAIYTLKGLDPSVWATDTAPATRSDALSVPALARGVDLISTTIAGLPIERVTASGHREDPGWALQPEADRPRFATLVDTVKDLLLDGRAFWHIHERTEEGPPKFGGVEYIHLSRVADVDWGDPARRTHPITIDGKRVPARDVIGFHGWHDGIRVHGARIIKTALALEKAAKRYADTPLPSMILKNTSTYELDDLEVSELLAGVKAARNQDAVGYINAGIELDTQGWDAAELQLVEARMFTNAQIANLIGVPAGLIAGASASGSTLTYQNVSQDNRAFIDFGLSPALKALESRLSMTDVMGRAWDHQVTPRGTVIRFNLQGILRGNPLERSQIYTALIGAGVITAEEARLMEDLAPEGRSEA